VIVGRLEPAVPAARTGVLYGQEPTIGTPTAESQAALTAGRRVASLSRLAAAAAAPFADRSRAAAAAPSPTDRAAAGSAPSPTDRAAAAAAPSPTDRLTGRRDDVTVCLSVQAVRPIAAHPAQRGDHTLPAQTRPASALPPASEGAAGVASELRTGTLSLFEVVLQGVATIAPAFAIIATFQFAVGQAGIAAPLVYLLAFVIVALLAITIGQLAKELPSAGGFSTYVSRAVHPYAGFLTGWIFLIWLPPACAIPAGYFAKAILEPELKSQWGVTVPWWLVTLAVIGVVAMIVYRGIAVSTKILVVLGVLEILIVVALAVSSGIDPGAGGFSLSPFDPGKATSVQGLYLGVVFSIFAFSGWEAVAPLSEETKNPRRNTPRALLGSVVVLGVFFLITSWLFIVGSGVDNVDGIVNATENPIFTLANRLWGGAWVILLLALLNSVIAVALGTFNSGSRTFFALGRTGALPRGLAKVDPKRGTPVNAITVQLAVTLAVFVFILLYGPEDAFALWGLTITLGLILTYIAVNIGVFRYFTTEARARFNPMLHAVLPLLGSLAVAWVFYKSVAPLPPAPGRYAPIVLGVWLALGIAILVFLKLSGKEHWIEEARRAAEIADEDEKPTTPGVAVS